MPSAATGGASRCPVAAAVAILASLPSGSWEVRGASAFKDVSLGFGCFTCLRTASGAGGEEGAVSLSTNSGGLIDLTVVVVAAVFGVVDVDVGASLVFLSPLPDCRDVNGHIFTS